MSTKDELKAFLVANIPSQVSTVTLASEDVYEGQAKREHRAHNDVWVRYLGKTPISRRTGLLERHSVDIAVTVIGHDDSREDFLTDRAEDIADEILTAYDENYSLFNANFTATTLSWVRVVRGAIDTSFHEKTVLLTLTLDEWVR